jgi:hypothetical protein
MAYDALGTKSTIPADLVALAQRVLDSPKTAKSPGRAAPSSYRTVRRTANGQDISDLREWMRTERTKSGLVTRKVRKGR